MKTTVVVAGAVANKPGNGGEAWVRMSWVDGLRRLGLDAWFVEELSPSSWGEATHECVAWFRTVTAGFGLGDRAILLNRDTSDVLVGPSPLPEADLLVNISGHVRSPAVLASCGRRAYIDVDPGYTQIWHLQGADIGLEGHDVHFTVGLNLGQPGCSIPTAGFRWQTVLPPVVLDEWPSAPSGGSAERFTTVASWRGGFGPLEYGGLRYGVKAHQFRRFVDLPKKVAATLELALEINPGDEADRRLLEEHGWRLVDPAMASGDPGRFRSYIQESDAEFSVAQDVYVATGSGWFSDRTARYLASGRPALVQDTGLGGPMRTGQGLVTFETVDDAITGAGEIRARYAEHCDAARRIAEDHLDAARVLPRFLEQAGVG